MDKVPITVNVFSALISAAKSDNVAEQEKAATRIRKLHFEDHAGVVLAHPSTLLEISEDDAGSEPSIPCADIPVDVQAWQPIHATTL